MTVALRPVARRPTAVFQDVVRIGMMSLVLSFLCFPALGQGGVAEERGSTESAFAEREGMNVAQQARLAFGAADRKIRQADELTEKIAAESEEKKREKLVVRREKAYSAAVENYREGLAYQPDTIEGWDGLGRAYRALGKYQEALLAHAEGMKRDAEDGANFLGWTETLMDGTMFGNAIAAYGQLAEEKPERAEKMLGVMENWLEERRQDPRGVDPADLDRLAEWIAAQK